MAQLIQLRQRIKAIETIKKITHAMRLISMSMHSRLRTKAPFLESYHKKLIVFFNKYECLLLVATCINANSLTPMGLNLLFWLVHKKGLCGNFNIILFHFFKDFTKDSNIKLIAVGKKAIDYAHSHNYPLIAAYSNLTAKNLSSLSYDIAHMILKEAHQFSEIIILSNILKTFFLQRPTATKLVPYTQAEDFPNQQEDYTGKSQNMNFLINWRTKFFRELFITYFFSHSWQNKLHALYPWTVQHATQKITRSNYLAIQ